MITVNNMTELRSLPGSAGDSVILLGYYTAGDKEPITYLYQSGAFIDDGGETIVPTAASSGAWIASFGNSNIIRVEHYGIISNDDSYNTAFNNAEIIKKNDYKGNWMQIWECYLYIHRGQNKF